MGTGGSVCIPADKNASKASLLGGNSGQKGESQVDSLSEEIQEQQNLYDKIVKNWHAFQTDLSQQQKTEDTSFRAETEEKSGPDDCPMYRHHAALYGQEFIVNGRSMEHVWMPCNEGSLPQVAIVVNHSTWGNFSAHLYQQANTATPIEAVSGYDVRLLGSVSSEQLCQDLHAEMSDLGLDHFVNASDWSLRVPPEPTSWPRPPGQEVEDENDEETKDESSPDATLTLATNMLVCLYETAKRSLLRQHCDSVMASKRCFGVKCFSIVRHCLDGTSPLEWCGGVKAWCKHMKAALARAHTMGATNSLSATAAKPGVLIPASPKAGRRRNKRVRVRRWDFRFLEPSDEAELLGRAFFHLNKTAIADIFGAQTSVICICAGENSTAAFTRVLEGRVVATANPELGTQPESWVSELKDCEEFRYQFSALLRPLVKASTQLHPGGSEGAAVCAFGFDKAVAAMLRADWPGREKLRDRLLLVNQRLMAADKLLTPSQFLAAVKQFLLHEDCFEAHLLLGVALVVEELGSAVGSVALAPRNAEPVLQMDWPRYLAGTRGCAM